MKRILHAILTVLVLGATLLPVPALAEDGTSSTPVPADYITVDGASVWLHSDNMAREGICSVQLTLTGAADFTIDKSLAADRLTHTNAAADGVTIYIAGATPLIPTGMADLFLGTVTPAAGGTVQLADNSLVYVYGNRTVARNVVDPADAEVHTPDDDIDLTAESVSVMLKDLVEAAKTADASQYTAEDWNALATALTNAQNVLKKYDDSPSEDMLEELIMAYKDLDERAAAITKKSGGGFADNNAGGAIGDGYDDGTGAGAPEPTQTPEPTEEPGTDASPEPAGEDGPVTRAVPDPTATETSAATSAPTAAPAVQTGSTGPSAPNTGDETVFVPWALMLLMSAAALAAVICRAKRRH